MEERPIEEYYEKAQELAINTQCLYYFREYVARGMQYQEAVTKREMIDKACEWLRNNLGYYDRHEVHIGKSYEAVVIDDFKKAMEE